MKKSRFQKFRFSKNFNWNPCLSIFRFLKILPTCTKMLLSSLLINRFSKIRILHKLQNTHYPFRRPTEVGGVEMMRKFVEIFFPCLIHYRSQVCEAAHVGDWEGDRQHAAVRSVQEDPCLVSQMEPPVSVSFCEERLRRKRSYHIEYGGLGWGEMDSGFLFFKA